MEQRIAALEAQVKLLNQAIEKLTLMFAKQVNHNKLVMDTLKKIGE